MNKKSLLLALKSSGLIAALLIVLSTGLRANAQNNPVANQAATVISGNARFTVLTPEMIRIEYSENSVFEDRATFTVVNRNLEVPSFEKTEDNEYLYINTGKLALKYRKGCDPVTLPASSKNLTITFMHNGREVLWYPGKPDPLNLKGTCRTLDGSNGDNKRSELENGLISRSGWSVIEDSWTTARPDGSRSFALSPDEELGYDWWAERKDPHALDIYFLGYGNNYKKALADFTKIAGKIPLPPAFVFGYWYSKYASYTSDDYRNIMAELANNDIPCDVMILDMDWHWNGDQSDSNGRGGWTGWSWNTKLIPDPKGLLNDIHSKNFKIGLNLHPADGITKSESPEYFAQMNSTLDGKYGDSNNIPWILDNTDFTKAFTSTILRDHESEGVDFWWLDWQQHLTSSFTNGLGETFWCNHVFFNDMIKNRPELRPLIFHRWGGLGSHRYQIGFSGDALINFPTLAFQPYFTATASNVGYGYWGHDLGGHAWTDESNANNPDLVLRWLQFGVFTPIFRTHATKDSRIERQIWKFPNFPTMLKAVKLRYALFPYIYTMAREAYDTGISICRPLYYDYPEIDEAYNYEGEYMFGNDILVAPITEASSNGMSSKEIWFPKGNWWSVSTNEMIEGPCVKTMTFTQEQIPYFFRQGAMIPFNPGSVKNVTERPDELIINVVAGADGESCVYEDDGNNSDYDANYATTKLSSNSNANIDEFVIAPREVTGNVSGLKAKRSYTFKIFNCDIPESVVVAGISLNADEYNYNPETRTLLVNVSQSDCDSEVKVVVKQSTSGIADVTADANCCFKYNKDTDCLEASFGKKMDLVDLSLCNLTGQMFAKYKYSNVDAICENISMLPSQFYLCRIVAGNSVMSGKFMK
ncbi:TIM-barrel domain-containing protein [uncultured Duncaniella sp.]|uniref:glycoside hydrolase family 31 protein n=1 Tax=uncultured Duncaniella sp. TaxID=2768039 RepID=UPI00321FD36C